MSWLSQLLGGLIGFFSQYLTKKIAVGAAVGTFLVSMTLAMLAAINGLLSGIAYSFPDSDILRGASMIIPSNFAPCISALMTAKVSKFAYEWNKETLKAISFIT